MVLTEKQKRFCEYYVEEPNAMQAAIKAGYSKKTARNIGHENLTKPYIREYIDSLLEQSRSQRIATAQEVMEYLTSVMRGESDSEIVVVEGVGKGYSKGRTMKKKPDEKERTRAAELLGKRFGMWTEKQPDNDVDSIKIVRAADGGIEIYDGT